MTTADISAAYIIFFFIIYHCIKWVTFCGWTTDGYHNRHYTGRFQGSRP